MNGLNAEVTKRIQRPFSMVQFGEGNFLRGFADWMIDIANEQGLMNCGIVIVKPIQHGNLDLFREQDCQYTVSLRGTTDGETVVKNRVVTSVMDAIDPYSEYERYAALARLDTLQFVVSNTTEAGIVYDETDEIESAPPHTYPGKLTKFLYERFSCFDGAMDKGLIIIPVELIDDNGIRLRECVDRLAQRWDLGNAFLEWLDEACVFCSTLVDRIVTGYPQEEALSIWEEFGYADRLLVTGEPFALWVIESAKAIQHALPLDKAGLPVVFTDNQTPYKQRKVRILNGAHTSFVLSAWLSGHDDVVGAMQDPMFRQFVRRLVFDEVIPTLALPVEDLKAFAGSVVDRFDNPFIKHSLLAISLNSVSKWRARCLPSLLAYWECFRELPVHITFSLAALLAFYQGSEIIDGALQGTRDGQSYPILDEEAVLAFFVSHSGKDVLPYTREFLSQDSFFGQSLLELPGLVEVVSGHLDAIRRLGMRGAMESVFQKEPD